MSILENNNQDEAKIVADSLISEAIGLYNHMNETYTNGTYRFWKHPLLAPQEIANGLGSKGKELFLLHYQLGQLLNSIKPGSIDSANSVISNFTMNEDGTVTVL